MPITHIYMSSASLIIALIHLLWFHVSLFPFFVLFISELSTPTCWTGADMRTTVVHIIHHQKRRELWMYQSHCVVRHTICLFLPWIISVVPNFMDSFVCFIYCMNSQGLKVADNVADDETRIYLWSLSITCKALWNESVVKLMLMPCSRDCSVRSVGNCCMCSCCDGIHVPYLAFDNTATFLIFPTCTVRWLLLWSRIYLGNSIKTSSSLQNS